MFCRLLVVFLFISGRLVDSQAPRCCPYTSGSCRTACENISLVNIAISPEERQTQVNRLHNLCSKLLGNFWSCINDTLTDIKQGEGWYGRTCCRLPQSSRCRLACVQAQSKEELTPECRHSDEISFFTCVEKNEVTDQCCNSGKTPDCRRACKKYFSTPNPAPRLHTSLVSSCSPHSPHVMQCSHNTSQTSPAANPAQNLYCCEKSLNPQCKIHCQYALRTARSGQEIVDSLIRGGCGQPLPHDKLWQCFLSNTRNLETEARSVSRIDHLGMDSVKLQCCFRSVSLVCQKLCIKMFTSDWNGNWEEFDKVCQYQVEEMEMTNCLAEVDNPCELGCDGLSFCSNFNSRPIELFRSCSSRADEAAQQDYSSWQKGIISLPSMDIPVLDISSCKPEVWKAIACTMQTKPCHSKTHSTMICKSDCIEILTKCVDRNKLSEAHTIISLCDILSPQGDDSKCISLTPYLTEFTMPKSQNSLPENNVESKALILREPEISHPCKPPGKPNPCNASEACIVNRNCQLGHPCLPYICLLGCKMGEMSRIVVPSNSYLRVPSTTRGPRCNKVCLCNHRGLLEDCVRLPCPSSDSCWIDGRKILHNTQFTMDCNTCFCYAGDVRCTKKNCNSNGHHTSHSPSERCNCPDHYVPVCGANGKTYPSACLARCADLTDDQFEFGACFESDPCSPNSCHPYDKCVPRKRVCLSIRHKSCKQYDCVNMHHPACNQQPKMAVCDTDNVEHPNICWMLQKKKSLAHHGKCMQHCRSNGPVCGHNGETYASECAAWAERVSVDYRGSCVAVGSYDGSSSSRCNGVKCSPLPSSFCPRMFPPGACCPICGASLRVFHSQKLADWSVEAVRDVEPVVLQTIAENLRSHVMTLECDVYAYLSLESDIIVIVASVTDHPTKIQVEACIKEAQKLQVLIQQGNPTLLTKLPLSFLTSAIINESVNGAAIQATSHGLIPFVVCFFFIQKVLLG